MCIMKKIDTFALSITLWIAVALWTPSIAVNTAAFSVTPSKPVEIVWNAGTTKPSRLFSTRFHGDAAKSKAVESMQRNYQQKGIRAQAVKVYSVVEADISEHIETSFENVERNLQLTSEEVRSRMEKQLERLRMKDRMSPRLTKEVCVCVIDRLLLCSFRSACN
jgi:uncharacterized protein YdcH (DUF465 family)